MLALVHDDDIKKDDQYLSSEHWNLQNSIRRVSPKGEEHFILCQGHAITLPLYALLLICLERLLQAPDQVCSGSGTLTVSAT
ncbi:hypothetical protein OIU76_013308 [Salix suchowensis]|nr:hypothetical protein OIU76_013308 [Salix suchowensis]